MVAVSRDHPGSEEEDLAIQDSPPLELRTLGSVELRDAQGRELEEVLHQPKRLALLIYLAVAAPGGFHRRDSIVALFWPELSDKRARNALSKGIHFLRLHLGSDVVESRGAAEIGVDPDRVWCDAVVFEEALHEGRHGDAVELYRGPFLEGFHIAETEELVFWLDRQRDHLAQRYTGALATLAGRAAKRGDPEGAAEWWRKLADHDPYNAHALLGLMEALEAVGERGAALQLAEEHAARLREELAAEPDPEVEAFALRLRQAPRAAPRETAPTHNLPSPPTPLVGRERELERLGELMLDPDVRLLTLTGPGGAGKTRLAIEAAEKVVGRFPGGVYFVSLASLRDAALVGTTIARTIGIKPAGAGQAAESLGEALYDRRVLLVLDSFEQVLPAADLVADLLGRTESLNVMVTSRAVLQLRGERVVTVPPLAVPADLTVAPEVALRYGAVELFVQRAQAVKPEFELTQDNARPITEICVRLDGLPLAIELAAARVRLLAPAMILSRLSDRFGLLTGGPRDLPERQQTLRRTFDWSYDLLSERERRLFRHLSVFVGGCSLEAIRLVCYPDGEDDATILNELTALADNSLLRQVEGTLDEPRFEMLETIREYGWRLLVDGAEAADVRRRHAGWLLQVAEVAEAGLAGIRQGVWLDRLEREYGNVQAVLDWALEWGEIELAVRLGSALWWFLWVRGHFGEMRWRLDQALARRELLPPSLQANLLVASGALASIDGDHERAMDLFQQAFAVEREQVGKREVGRALRSMAFALSRHGEYDRAIELLEESLALSRELDSPADIAADLRGLAKMRFHVADNDRAEALYTEALELGRDHGDRQAVAWALAGLSEVARQRTDIARADKLLEEALAVCREIDSKPGTAYLLLAAGHVARYRGQLTEARERYREALRLLRELGNRRRAAIALLGLAALDIREGALRRGVLLFGAVDPLLDRVGFQIAPVDKAEYERAVTSVRAELDATEIEALVATGRAMDLDAAIELALGESGPDDA
jgi:predicted ATPase/DNA-binding SARP family transcriptional activator